MCARSEKQSGNHAGDLLPSPRHSLQFKAIVAVVALVTIPTSVCGYLTGRMAVGAADRILAQDAEALAQMIARAAEHELDQADRDLPDLDRLVEQMGLSERVAFICIRGDAGDVVAPRINDAAGWHIYLDRIPSHLRISPLNANRSVTLLSERGPLAVSRQPIWKAPRQDRAAGRPARAGAASAPQFYGYVELGLHAAEQPQTIANLKTATAAVVCVICLLCVPLVVWVTGWWTRPLRRMLAGTMRLSAGQSADTVPGTHRNDEVGQLAKSFNSMATHLWDARADLVLANTQLEAKVNQRTEQLRQSNQRLLREMQDKDEFIRAVSHDLGAPLRNIAGMTRLLMVKHREQMADEMVAKLERIAANVKSETELLNDLLELSRIKTRPGKAQRVDLEALARQLAQSLSYEMESKQIQLIEDSPLPVLYADRNRMRQLLQNLMDNAIKYMPDDAPVREIHVGCRTDEDQVVFYVRDTGAGISQRDQENIFQVFRRAQYSGTSQTEGRGVGLATVRSIVECYGGQVWVDSEPGRGATFCFTLDRQYLTDPTAEPAGQTAPTEPHQLTER